MLYVAIDQHAKQVTVAIRDDQGEDVLKRQVSTRREKIEQFFDQVVAMDAEFMAILDSCGFNDWLLEELHNRKCREIVLIHPERPSKKKTDRRDAHKLCDLLWLNRERLAAAKPVHGLCRIYIATKQESRRIDSVRSPRKVASLLGSCWDSWFCTFSSKIRACESGIDASSYDGDRRLPVWQ
jgi:transposase